MDLSSPKISSLSGEKNITKLSLDGNVFGGQTPTPTKLIENCEKYGIFDDWNKNPFEEVFRQAVEYNNTDPINKPILHHNEDSLHTPQVVGHKENVENLNEEHITKSKTSKRKLKSVKPRTILPNETRPFIISNGMLISHPQIISITTYPPKSPVNQAPHTTVKQKLKEAIISNGKSDQLEHTKAKERSKASSSRYRQKTKMDHILLKKKYKEMLSENLVLKNRIIQLENIVAKQSSSSGHSAIHIEPQTVRFEMNIPKMVILSGQK
ncbi:ATF2 family protein [Megaselia abdita]